MASPQGSPPTNEIYSVLAAVLDSAAPLTIVECGAHDGTDSLHLRRLFPRARMFSFEPDPRNVATIRARGIDLMVTFIPAAVGDRDGEAVLHLSSANLNKPRPEWITGPDWSASSSLKEPAEHLVRHPWCEFNLTAKVPVMRLDTLRLQAGLGTVDLIWADVQGAEDLLLAGGQLTLAETRYFYTEYADAEVYRGQIGLPEILGRLPGSWEIVRKFQYDVLLRNMTWSTSESASKARERTLAP